MGDVAQQQNPTERRRYRPGDRIQARAPGNAVPTNWQRIRLVFQSTSGDEIALVCNCPEPPQPGRAGAPEKSTTFTFDGSVPVEAKLGVYVANKIFVHVPFEEPHDVRLVEPSPSFEVVAHDVPTFGPIELIGSESA
jgi:hypothetical protein